MLLRALARLAFARSPRQILPPERLRLFSDEAKEKRKELYSIFTCTKCATRSVKGFSKKSFHEGVVTVTCDGCKARHLIADRYGWFGALGSVLDFVKETSKEEAGSGIAMEE